MYKMLQISKEEYEKFEIEITDKGRYFWANRKDLEVESDVANWVQIFDKCDSEKQEYKNSRLMQHINNVGCLCEMI